MVALYSHVMKISGKNQKTTLIQWPLSTKIKPVCFDFCVKLFPYIQFPFFSSSYHVFLLIFVIHFLMYYYVLQIIIIICHVPKCSMFGVY